MTNEQKLEKIIAKEPNSYLWEDENTFDLLIYDANLPFINHVRLYTCPVCDNSIIKNNESLLKTITATVKGIFITCKNCKTEYFIHTLVSDKSVSKPLSEINL